MIFKSEVQEIAEDFLKKAMGTTYPSVLDALLAHPKLNDWYAQVAATLSEEKAKALLEGVDLDTTYIIRSWASDYVKHVLEKYDNIAS